MGRLFFPHLNKIYSDVQLIITTLHQLTMDRKRAAQKQAAVKKCHENSIQGSVNRGWK